KVVSTDRNYNFTMPDVNAELVAVFEYNPTSPQDPGTNSWNAETGELIIDAFEQDNLSSAIYDVTGGSTNSVQTLIVNGKVSNYDIGNMANYPFSLVDFSRCAGATSVPSWSFENNSTLTSISLPSSITDIEYYAFSNCTSLTSVSCYATVPPTLGTNVFNGIKEQLVVFVPATSIDLYQEAAGWKDMTILPLSSQVNALEVNLPAGCDDGRFKNMFIELVNANSGQRMRYVISDRTAYTFQNLMHNTKWNVYVKNATGQVLGQMENIEMQTSDRSVTFQSLIEPQTIKAVVKTPDGTDVSGQMAFTWMTADGTYLAQGASVSGILPIDDAAVILRATLPQALAMQYQLISDTTFVVQTSGNTITQTLVALPTAKLTGTVRDVLTNAVLGGANVTVSQTLNGKYSKAFTTTANAQGVYSLDAFYAPTSITAVATDYISQTVLYDSLTIENGVATLEDIALKSINGATITLNFTYTPAALSGSAAETQTYYSDYQNVAYAIRDITTGQDIKQFNVQYPQIVLLEDVALGDSLQLTATSKTGSFMPVVAKGKVNDMNRAEVTFDIKQLGQISATFVSTENSAVNGILYDSKGKFVKNVAYSNAALSFKELTDGDYTLITMGNSKLFNTIYDLSKFEQAGLKDGTDYVATPVKVQSGVISAVKTSYVPFFDESKLYYTGDNTSFTVNKTQVTAGNYLTINSRIDFKSLYANEVSNVRLVVDLPSTCSLVDNSVMVGSGLSTYISAAGRVTIPVDNLNDRIRFCVIPTAGGDYAPSAYVQFAYNGQEVTQPIGSANFTVKDLSITAPSVVAKTSVPLNGTAVGKSKVEIFDNGVLIGETTALANGTWATSCELDDPYNLSTHKVYAKVTTLTGLEMQSEAKNIVYDMNAIQVSKVIMYHYNPEMNKTFQSAFDFMNPSTKANQWTVYYPRKLFTYTLEFTNNSPDKVSNVKLYVHTADGRKVPLTPKYDEKKDLWVADIDMGNRSDGYYPVNVSVGYSIMGGEVEIDYRQIQDAYETSLDLRPDIESIDGEYESFTQQLLNAYDDSIIDGAKIEGILSSYRTALGLSEDDSETIYLQLKEMTPEQLAAFRESLLQEVNAFESAPILDYYENGSDLLKDYDYSFVIDEIPFKVIRKSCKDLVPENLVADGYREVSTLSGEIIYVKGDNNYLEIVDFKADYYSKIELVDGYSNVKKISVSGMWETAIRKMDECNNMLVKAQTAALDAITEIADFFGQKIANLTNTASNLRAMAKVDREMGLLEGSGELLSSAKDLEKQAMELEKQAAKYQKLTADAKVAGKAIVGKIVQLLGSVASLTIDVKNWWNLHKRIEAKIPCKGNESYALELSSDVTYYGSLICTGDVVTLAGAVFSVYSAAMGLAGTPLTGGLSTVIGGTAGLIGAGVSIAAGFAFDWLSKRTYNRLNNEVSKLKCEDDDDDVDDDDYDDHDADSGSPDDDVQIDPSGYVYEGVQSNRLQGVTATCYYKETGEDMYGDPYEKEVLWDAEEYAQENPLFTDENGFYRWDVPQGLWRVKFEKEGYQTTYSEWLPVPPPQL
ncbi:MAG: leucine-rich repeat protein, partial [Prevotella sp.]|nr:leucine-rich repeat protein [Prevotella sp.]